MEYHQHDENTTYHIMNKAFVRQDLDNVEVLGKEVPLSAVPEWANLEEAVTILNVKKPLFAYFKIPNANNVDDSSPLGVSVYSEQSMISKKLIINGRESYGNMRDLNWQSMQTLGYLNVKKTENLIFQKEKKDSFG